MELDLAIMARSTKAGISANPRIPTMHLFHVPDLMCGSWLGFVVRALQDIDHAIRIEANLQAHTIRVISRRFETAFLQAFRGAGYPAEPVLLPLR
jgi:copper chaperone